MAARKPTARVAPKTASKAAKPKAPAKPKRPQSKAPEALRDERGRLQKGASGNPGGVPKWRRELTEALKDDAQYARRLLRKVIKSDAVEMQHRVAAAGLVLKLTVPPPKRQIDVTSGERPLAHVSTEAIEAFLRRKR